MQAKFDPATFSTYPTTNITIEDHSGKIVGKVAIPVPARSPRLGWWIEGIGKGMSDGPLTDYNDELGRGAINFIPLPRLVGRLVADEWDVHVPSFANCVRAEKGNETFEADEKVGPGQTHFWVWCHSENRSITAYEKAIIKG